MDISSNEDGATWYFDFISPFAYLQWQKLKVLDVPDLRPRPVLLAGLLKEFGHKGPAEIAGKRLFTYRCVQWRADRAGIPLIFPPAHPFNPLPALRLCVAAGTTAEAIDALFNHIWRDGLPADTPDALAPVAKRLGIDDLHAALSGTQVRETLQHNFAGALSDGVFGVPTLVMDSQVFWGDDATELFTDYLANRDLFSTPAMKRLETLPEGIQRRIGS